MSENFPFQKLYESMSKTATNLETYNHLLTQEKEVLAISLINCQKALDITKETMRNALTMQNEMKDAYSAEIEQLRAEIKRLKNGNND
jgi:hypothetical protein